MSDALSPAVWVPKYLFVLQSMAHSYSDHPNAVLKQKYFSLVVNLAVSMPDPEWQRWFGALSAEDLPVSAFLANRDTFSDWVWRVRCSAHRRLGWRQPTFAAHQDEYYAAYRPPPLQQEAFDSGRRHVTGAALGLAVLALGFVLGRKA